MNDVFEHCTSLQQTFFIFFQTPPLRPHFSMSTFAVKALDHVVLTVKSIPKTIDFYTTRLGMKHASFISKGGERYRTLTFFEYATTF